MHISFFRFNIKPEYWKAVEKFLKDNKATEYDIRNCLTHTTTNFVIEKCTRFYSDHIIDLKDSYSIQSQRYVNFKDKYDFFYIPDEIKQNGYEEKWKNHINEMIERYSALVERGIKPEDARFILPITFYSNVKSTLKGDRLLDFIAFNYSNSKFDEHREIHNKFVNQFDEKYKILIDNIMRIVKEKTKEFEKQNMYTKIWTTLFKPGEFGVHFHNDAILESSIGASICYRAGSPSEYIDKFSTEKQEKLLEKIFSVKHESVTEHGTLTVQMPISRIIHSHIQRHRMGNRTNTSTIDAVKNFTFVTPPDVMQNVECKRIFEEGMEKCKQMYDELVQNGVSNENASYALPNALKIDTMITTNIRDIRHILRTRLCERAHWEVRGLAYKMFEELYSKSPLLVSDLGPSCYKGKCKEGDFCCGKPHIFKEFINDLKQKYEMQEEVS